MRRLSAEIESMPSRTTLAGGALLDAQVRTSYGPQLPAQCPGASLARCVAEGEAGPAGDLDGRDQRAQAERAFDDWIERYQDKYPKATACLARDREQLLAFYDFPAVALDAPAHDQRDRVVVRHHPPPQQTGEGLRHAVRRMLSMIYKMGMSAEKSWRRLRGFRQLGKVIEGVKFNDGIEVTEDSRAVA